MSAAGAGYVAAAGDGGSSFDWVQDLLAMNYADEPAHDPVAVRDPTRRAWEHSWRAFEAYFDHAKELDLLHVLPGYPQKATDYLQRDFPHIDYATCAAYLLHWASHAQGRIDPVATLSSAHLMWRSFSAIYADGRGGNAIPDDLRKQVNLYLRQDLLDRGLLTNSTADRPLVDPRSLRALAEAMVDPRFSPFAPRARLQMLLFQAIEIRSGMRAGDSLPATCTDVQDGMRYEHFTLNVLRPTDNAQECELTLLYAQPRSKTDATEFAKRPFKRADQAWRDPVLLFLAIAQIDDALPATAKQMLSLSFLQGRDAVQVRAKPEKQSLFVCRTGDDACWNTALVRVKLKELSIYAGFPRPMTTHAYRRTAALWMRAAGNPLEAIGLKLGHTFTSATVTECYMRQAPGADVGAAVFDLSDDALLESISLHPDVLRTNARAKIALPQASRLEVLQHGEVVAAVQACDSLRDAVVLEHGSVQNAPEKEQRQLKKAWNALSDIYHKHCVSTVRRLAKAAELDDVEADLEQQMLDQIPAEGADLDYDAVATIELLETLELRNLKDAREFADQQQELAQIALDEADEELAGFNGAHTAVSGGGAVLDIDKAYEHGGEELAQLFQLQDDKLGAMRTVLFKARNEVDTLKVINTLSDLPPTRQQIAGYRPGHAPYNGNCVGCGRPLSEVVKASGAKTKQAQRDSYAEACVTHVHSCTKLAYFKLKLPSLLAKYPSSVEQHPFPPRVGRRRRVELSLQVLTRDLCQRFGKQCDFKCQCGFSCASSSLAFAHLLQAHTLHLPSRSDDGKEHLEAGHWDQRSARFLLPTYYYADSSYHHDPQELESFAEGLYQRLIVTTSTDIQHYGLRDDVVYPAGFLGGEEHGAGCDSRCSLVIEKRNVVQEGFCFLCVTDESLSFTERMEPFHHAQTLRNHVRHHFANLVLLSERHRKYINPAPTNSDSASSASKQSKGAETPTAATADAAAAAAAAAKGKAGKGKASTAARAATATAATSGRITRAASRAQEAQAAADGGVQRVDSASNGDGISNDDGADEVEDSEEVSDREQEARVPAKRKRGGSGKQGGVVRHIPRPSIFHQQGYRCPDNVCAQHERTFPDSLSLSKHLAMVHCVPFKSEGVSKCALDAGEMCFATQIELEDMIGADHGRNLPTSGKPVNHAAVAPWK